MLRAIVYSLRGSGGPPPLDSHFWRASADPLEIRPQGIDFHHFRPLAARGSDFTSLAGLRGHTGNPASGL
jgi:hypothetical protein